MSEYKRLDGGTDAGDRVFQPGTGRHLQAQRTGDGKLLLLPDETLVFPAHDYLNKGHSTIGAEKAGNPRVAGKTLAEFRTIMDELNWPMGSTLSLVLLIFLGAVAAVYSRYMGLSRVFKGLGG